MKSKILFLITSQILFFNFFCFSQKSSNPSPNKVLYTVGYSHLDTEWVWDYPQTINVCLKNLLEENFYLLEKYPDYRFNFTGSRRYKMLQEYYPEQFEKVKDYIAKGRWFVSGSSVDEGEVNVSSPESVIRQVLYGNHYFKKTFNKKSVDYMLPDCFGFQANMPSIWHHSGLLGFSTQKLTWRSANGVPFNVGVWNGPDGKGIIAAFNATNYSGHVEERLDKSEYWTKRMNENQTKYGINFDYRYYGVGDEGGAPRENDVLNAVNSLNNDDAEIKVMLTSSDQMYKDITPEQRSKLPVYSGDLLLIEHSAGSQTSQAFMKRLNRKNEILAGVAEETASIANFLGLANYPHSKLNNAWDLVLGSQFHDILPGTSLPKAYEYAWNDEFVAANGFEEITKNAFALIANQLNTEVKGEPLVVFNSVAKDREDIVSAKMKFENNIDNITVYDKDGNSLPTQVLGKEDGTIHFIFPAKIPSVGFAVYDVRTESKPSNASTLRVLENSLENEYYKVTIAANGDVKNVFDKKQNKELLSSPAKLEFLEESPKDWPAWNMDWEDRKNPPIDYLDKNAAISILENGPVRVALLIKRSGQNSETEQVVSLATGEAGKRVEVNNVIDWQSQGVSLKASFPFTIANDKATYNLGVGTIERGNNDPNKFEVPSRQWFDLTSPNKESGVSILEDCKYASDKPDDNTLRLTLMYTPKVGKNFNWVWFQSTQDIGIQKYKYALYSHKGNWTEGNTQWQAQFFNQPLLAFETTKHNGSLGKTFSFLKNNSEQVGLMAFKKAEDSDYFILRVNELHGTDAKNVEIGFPATITDAYEVNGQEEKIGTANFEKEKLLFDLGHNTIRSFAVKLKTNSATALQQQPINLEYNYDLITNDKNRFDCNNGNGGLSYPAELLPDNIISEDVVFIIKNKEDRKNNCIASDGQTINLPEGNYNKLYILASANNDVETSFKIDDKEVNLSIQAWTGIVGQHYKRIFNNVDQTLYKVEDPFYKTDNIAWFASHRHKSYPTANEAYQYCYLYKYEIDLPANAKTLVLPKNKDVKIFAITVAQSNADDIILAQPLFDRFDKNEKFEMRK